MVTGKAEESKRLGKCDDEEHFPRCCIAHEPRSDLSAIRDALSFKANTPEIDVDKLVLPRFRCAAFLPYYETLWACVLRGRERREEERREGVTVYSSACDPFAAAVENPVLVLNARVRVAK